MGLTKKQAEILEFIRDHIEEQGYAPTYREIAEALAISEETVKSHIGNILSKLHLAHRTQAALYAVKQGLISLDELKL